MSAVALYWAGGSFSEESVESGWAGRREHVSTHQNRQLLHSPRLVLQNGTALYGGGPYVAKRGATARRPYSVRENVRMART